MEQSIQICIEKEWDIRKSTKNFASLSNEDLLMFMIAKSDNKYNRIEIIIHEESERVRMLDIFNTDEASTLISMQLTKLNSN